MDWFTEEYQKHMSAEYERIRAKHPSLVTVGFECYFGWFGIVERYFDGVAALLEQHPGAKFRVSQIKEKLGGIRIYSDESTVLCEPVEALVREAEIEADRTCEVCGAAGVLRVIGFGYYSTRCDAHAEGGHLATWQEPTEIADHLPGDEPKPWGSGNVFHDLGLPDPDDDGR